MDNSKITSICNKIIADINKMKEEETSALQKANDKIIYYRGAADAVKLTMDELLKEVERDGRAKDNNPEGTSKAKNRIRAVKSGKSDSSKRAGIR